MLSGQQLRQIVKVPVRECGRLSIFCLIAYRCVAAVHADDYRSIEFLSRGAPAGKRDVYGAGEVLLGDKCNPVHIGAAGTVVVPAFGYLAVVAAVSVIVIQRPLRSVREFKAHIVQRSAGQLPAQGIEIAVIKGDPSVPVGGVAHIAVTRAPHLHRHCAGKAVALGVPAGKRDMNRAGIILPRYKCNSPEIGGGGTVVAASLRHLAVIAAIAGVVVVKRPFGGIRPLKLHVIQGVARHSLGQVVKIVVIKGHLAALGNGVGEIPGVLSLRDADGNASAEGAPVAVIAGIGDHHLSPVACGSHKGDVGQVGASAALILLGGVHLAAVILLGDIVVIECPPAAVRLGKDDIAQFPARVAAANPVKVIRVQ